MLTVLLDLAYLLHPCHPFWDLDDHPLSQAWVDTLYARKGTTFELPTHCALCLLDWLWNDWIKFLSCQN